VDGTLSRLDTLTLGFTAGVCADGSFDKEVFDKDEACDKDELPGVEEAEAGRGRFFCTADEDEATRFVPFDYNNNRKMVINHTSVQETKYRSMR